MYNRIKYKFFIISLIYIQSLTLHAQDQGASFDIISEDGFSRTHGVSRQSFTGKNNSGSNTADYIAPIAVTTNVTSSKKRLKKRMGMSFADIIGEISVASKNMKSKTVSRNVKRGGFSFSNMAKQTQRKKPTNNRSR